MNKFTKEDLLHLAGPHEGWCVSIYMPTIEKSQEVRQNPIRFKNLVNQVEEELNAGGMDNKEASEYLAPLTALVKNEIFWQQQDQGLAVFMAQEFLETFQLPYEVDEVAMFNDQFYLKPLLPLLDGGDEFFILALSQNEVRFLKASPQSVDEIDLPDLPSSLDEALRKDSEDQFQWHTSNTRASGIANRGGEYSPVFHGHSDEEGTKDEDLRQYFRKIDTALNSYLKDNKAPLVLAGVEYLVPLYKDANRYPHLSDEVVKGSPKLKKNEELRDEAWKLIKPVFQTTKEEVVERYRMLSGRQDALAMKDTGEIIKAAPYGRVEVLFVNKNAKRWGDFDPTHIDVRFDEQRQPGSRDLLDFAAIQTLQNGGAVYALDPEEMPEPGAPVAAILRY